MKRRLPGRPMPGTRRACSSIRRQYERLLKAGYAELEGSAQRSSVVGETANGQADAAERRMDHRCPAVLLHADQFCRQGHHRPGRSADHEGSRPHAPGVRAGQLQLLLPVLAVGDRHRFSRQPRPDALGAAGHGPGLGTDPVPDAGHRQPRYPDRLPHRAGRRRRAGLSGRPACHLQVVPQRAAHAADCCHLTGRRRWRGHRHPRPQLRHRAVLLALGVRPAGHRGPRMGGRLVPAGARRQRSGRDRRPKRIPHRAGALPQAAPERDCSVGICRVLRVLSWALHCW